MELKIRGKFKKFLFTVAEVDLSGEVNIIAETLSKGFAVDKLLETLAENNFEGTVEVDGRVYRVEGGSVWEE